MFWGESMDKNVYTVQIDDEVISSSTGSKSRPVKAENIVGADFDFIDMAFSRGRKKTPSTYSYSKQVTEKRKSEKPHVASAADYAEFDFAPRRKQKAQTKESVVEKEEIDKTKTSKVKEIVSKPKREVSTKVSITKIIEVKPMTAKISIMKFLPIKFVELSSINDINQPNKNFKEEVLKLKNSKSGGNKIAAKLKKSAKEENLIADKLITKSTKPCVLKKEDQKTHIEEPECSKECIFKEEPLKTCINNDLEVEKIISIARLGSLFDCDCSAMVF